MCFASYFVNAFAEKIDSRKTSPVSRVHTNTEKQYIESTGGPWKLLTVPGYPIKANLVAFAMENRPQSQLLFC